MQGSCLVNFIIFRRGNWSVPPFVRDLHLFFGRSKPLPYRLIVYSVVFVNHRGMPRTSSPTVNIKI